MMTANCDVDCCDEIQEWNNDDPEYRECPEHWGWLVLSDSQGELQGHWLCPKHLPIAWKLFEVVPGSSSETSLLHDINEVCKKHGA